MSAMPAIKPTQRRKQNDHIQLELRPGRIGLKEVKIELELNRLCPRLHVLVDEKANQTKYDQCYNQLKQPHRRSPS